MVAPSVPRLDFVPQVNLSRAFLHRAYDALQAGRIFEAGVLLRESVRRQLYAECAWKGCLPEKEGECRSPLALLKALQRAGQVSQIGFEWTCEIIEIGNKCAHCVPVRPGEIRMAIEIWHNSIDEAPCGEPTERVAHCKPQESSGLFDECDDCGDDDPADWWKEGGGE